MDVKWLVIISVVISVQTSAAPPRPPPPKWVDLSYQFAVHETLYWPGQKLWQHDLVFSGKLPDGIFMAYSKYAAGEHGGTHMDAPIHFDENGITLEKIKIESVVGEAVVINISAKADKNPIAELEVSDVKAWEDQHGRIPDKAIVFMYTGRGRFWPDKVKYFGTNTPDNYSTFHYPGLHAKAAEWLINERKMKLFGLDTPSFDQGQHKGFPTHKVMLGRGVPGIENVANLHLLPTRGAEVFAAPMKIKDGTGGPVRVFARIVDKKAVDAAALANHKSFVSTVVMVIAVILFLFFKFNV